MYSYTFIHNGVLFTLTTERDLDMGRPWEEHDGHGVIRVVDRVASKRPGERVLYRDNWSAYLYDIPATLAKAKAEGWGDGDERTAKERIADAVERDYERMKAWVNDDWWWMGIIVTLKVGKHTYRQSVWGIESDVEDDYIMQTARELADAVLAEASEWKVCPCCKGEGRVEKEG